MERPEHDVDTFAILWKRKLPILLVTAGVAILAGLVSLFLPRAWEVDAIIQPSRLFVETKEGRFEEFYVADARQLAGQISQSSYDGAIAEELKLDLREFPRLRAENLRDTKLVRVSLMESDVERGKAILRALFNRLKKELDDKIDVELKGMLAAIETSENKIKKEQNEIQSREIAISGARQDIATTERKLQISQERVHGIGQEMKEVKSRIDQIEKEQRLAISESKGSRDAISLLLYSNEIQQNLRYYDSLEERLSLERVNQENLNLHAGTKEQEIRQLRMEMEKLNRDIDIIRTEIELQKERKRRMKYAELVKDPTPTVYPVRPNKKLIVAIAAVLALMLSSLAAIVFDSVRAPKP